MKPMGRCNLTIAVIATGANLVRLKEICRISILENKLCSNVPALRLGTWFFMANTYLGSVKIALQTFGIVVT